MVEDICFHVVDLVQNAVAAGARTVAVSLRESAAEDELSLTVRDDGRGMDAETAAKARDPFYTSKGFKPVGLGLPLLEATAESCGGRLELESEPGRGTAVRARMVRSHWDRPPLGDLPGTLLGMLVALDGVDLRFDYRGDRGDFSISSAEARVQAGGLHLSHPAVYSFLRELLDAELRPLLD